MTGERFVILDPRKRKRAWIAALLAPLGRMRWLKLPPMSPRGFPETATRAAEALETASKQPKGALGRAAKLRLLAWQYNGARRLFGADPQAVAVCWNGLNGSRRAFRDGAHDAGARTLVFELAPLPGRITVDRRGVNFDNELPREIGFYRDWFARRDGDPEAWRAIGAEIRQRAPARPAEGEAPSRPLTEPFLFAPLQVPGDTQLRLHGGAYRTVEAFLRALCQAAGALPEGWHLRIKEHPTKPAGAAAIIADYPDAPVVLDNVTDTFAQVQAARGVLTVNSSVGLEAMWFDKPVVACGQCFWALDGVALRAPDAESLRAVMAAPEALTFDPGARAAFLTYLDEVYYPRRVEPGQAPAEADLQKTRARLRTGPLE